jgi:hypothetical protein
VRLVDCPCAEKEGGREGGRDRDLTVCVPPCDPAITWQGVSQTNYPPKKSHLHSYLRLLVSIPTGQTQKHKDTRISPLCELGAVIFLSKCNKVFNL